MIFRPTEKSGLFEGAFVAGVALFGILYLVPNWVKAPGRVDIPVLAPSFWPNILFYLMLGLGVLLMVESLFKGRQEDRATDDRPPPLNARLAFRTVLAILILFAYYFLIDIGGIVAASIVASLALMLLAGERRLFGILIVSTGLPILLYYFFTRVANTPMPLGLFGN